VPDAKEQGAHYLTTGDGVLSGASPTKHFPQVYGCRCVVGSPSLSFQCARFHIATFSALHGV
jgi:hypothetical protein